MVEKRKTQGKWHGKKWPKRKKCVIPIKNNDDLCLAKAIVTMKERAIQKYYSRQTHSRTVSASFAPRSRCCRRSL